MVCEGKNIRRDGKRRFVYLCIFVFTNKITALGGHRFECLNNNQMGDGDDVRGCVGEEVRLGRNVWEGRLPVVWRVELIDKK